MFLYSPQAARRKCLCRGSRTSNTSAYAGMQTPEGLCDSLGRITEASAHVHHLQGLELDGHKLLIQLSQRKRLADDDKKGGKATAGGKANTTKLVRHCLLTHSHLLARRCTATASMA